jgi:hypothetical protein
MSAISTPRMPTKLLMTPKVFSGVELWPAVYITMAVTLPAPSPAIARSATSGQTPSARIVRPLAISTASTPPM